MEDRVNVRIAEVLSTDMSTHFAKLGQLKAQLGSRQGAAQQAEASAAGVLVRVARPTS